MGPGGGGGGGLRDGSRVVEPADARWRRLLASDVREYGLQRPHPCLQVKGTVNSKLIFHIIICYSKIIFYRMSYYELLLKNIFYYILAVLTFYN